VIKLGGKAFSGTSIEEVAEEIKGLEGHAVCLVHGGGREVNDCLARFGIAPTFINGLRATDGPTMEVVEMVLSGKVNPGLVGQLNRFGLRAVGLCGKDGGLLSAKPVHPETGLGLVGEPETIHSEILFALWENGFVPVISPIGASPEGGSLNLNADTVACVLARALRADILVLFTDSEGVYGGGNGRGQLIPTIKAREVDALITQGTVTGGMIPKVREAGRAKSGGVGRAWITCWDSTGLKSLDPAGDFHGTEIL
jgi:acetylglutamate kinase